MLAQRDHLHAAERDAVGIHVRAVGESPPPQPWRKEAKARWRPGRRRARASERESAHSKEGGTPALQLQKEWEVARVVPVPCTCAHGRHICVRNGMCQQTMQAGCICKGTQAEMQSQTFGRMGLHASCAKENAGVHEEEVAGMRPDLIWQAELLRYRTALQSVFVANRDIQRLTQQASILDFWRDGVPCREAFLRS